MRRNASGMPARPKAGLALGVAVIAVTAAVAGAGGAGAASKPVSVKTHGKTLTAKPLSASDLRTTPKDGADDLARTDPSLLRLHGSQLVPVMVKLNYTSVAAYRGTIKGLKATSPRVTGRAINRRSKAVRAYGRYI